MVSVPSAIFFDVDGVLIDSMDIKAEAFAGAFADRPDLRDAIFALHHANGGVTRSAKIALIFRNLLKVEPTPGDIDERVAAFSDAVVTQVVAAPAIEGADDAVAHWSGLTELHAVSATPDDELKRIFDSRGMTELFATVQGCPPAKADLVDATIVQRGLDRARCVLVGDSREDHAAAQATGIAFIQVRPAGVPVFAHGVASIPDLRELDQAISAALAHATE